MGIVKKVFEKTELILALSIVLPLLLAVDLSSFKIGIEICLGVVMYFSIRPFLGHKLHRESSWLLAVPVIINYVLLSGVYLILAYIFLGVGNDFFTGYVLIALVPAAVAIIPFCYLSKCDEETADIPFFVSFFLSLIIIPLALNFLFGKNINYVALARIILIIMITPMFIAYMTSKSKSKLFDYSKSITNICLGLVVFISISLNRKVFFDFSNSDIIYVYLINFLVIFGLGLMVYFVSRWLVKEEAVTYSFYASQKNVGTAITLGVLLFNPNTAVPAIIALALQFMYFIFFEELFVKKNKIRH